MNVNLSTEIETSLKELRLPAIRECYAEQAESSRAEKSSYEAYLYELLTRELEERRHKRTERLLRESKLPLGKSLESFEMKRLPAKVSFQVKSLLEGEFLDRCENVLVFGNPGSGKTHLLCAIGQELIYKGRRVLFAACGLLIQELLYAKRELKLSRLLKKLSKYEALIIDDIGYVQHTREEMEVFFALLAERYERGSILLSSNLPFSKWETIFKDSMVTAAAIDRLVHHCIILELNLPSYRLEKSKAKLKKKPIERR